MRWLHVVIAVVVFAFDQGTKAAVEATIPLHDVRTVIPGLFRLTHVKNRGAAFGIFADSTSPIKIEFLIVLSIISLAIVLTLLWRQNPSAPRTGIGLALILGGAFGNLSDRVAHGSVVDFLNFYIQSYQWPSFNVADSAIVIGAALLILDMLVTPAKRQVKTD